MGTGPGREDGNLRAFGPAPGCRASYPHVAALANNICDAPVLLPFAIGSSSTAKLFVKKIGVEHSRVRIYQCFSCVSC